MNYNKIYNQLIIKCKSRKSLGGYTEQHHIIPKSLGGSDNSENLVVLSAREHFIAHYLLYKIQHCNTTEWFKMATAFNMMRTSSNNHQRYINSRLYSGFREKFSKAMSLSQSGSNNSQYGTKWMVNPETGDVCKVSIHNVSVFAGQGWIFGRKVTKCQTCGIPVKHSWKYCDVHRKDVRESLKGHKVLVGREDEFYQLYESTGSMNKALKAMGFPGAISHWYNHAKYLLDDQSRIGSSVGSPADCKSAALTALMVRVHPHPPNKG